MIILYKTDLIYITVSILQVLQSILKVFDVKWSYEKKTLKLVLLNFVISLVWIVATAVGVSAIINGDYLMMLVYVLSGGFGKYLAMIVLGHNKLHETKNTKLRISPKKTESKVKTLYAKEDSLSDHNPTISHLEVVR